MLGKLGLIDGWGVGRRLWRPVAALCLALVATSMAAVALPPPSTNFLPGTPAGPCTPEAGNKYEAAAYAA